MIKLDLGCGAHRLPGYTPIDASIGHDVRCLPFADNVADEIRASHVLEHIGYDDVPAVLKHWSRVLKPGGWMKIAVPDFDKVIDLYKQGKGSELPIEGYLLGGRTDSYDIHQSIYQTQKLKGLLESAGLVDVQPWEGDADDCSRHPITLNLKGRKPEPNPLPQHPKYTDMALVQTCPRLTFSDFAYSAIGACTQLGISMTKHTGVFWTQGIDRVLREALAKPHVRWVITADYDSVFTADDIVRMRDIADRNGCDVLAPLQAGRERVTPLLSVQDKDGNIRSGVYGHELAAETMQVATAHFGLTLIRADALRKVPSPWFKGEPAPDGSWGEGHMDDDIWFWKQWQKAGLKAWITPRVTIGHAEQVIAWIDRDMRRRWQATNEYYTQGKPWYAQ